MKVRIPYKPRSGQAQLHTELAKHRWAVVVCHRRWGKTVMAINHLLRDAIMCRRERPRFHYISPTYRQAKMISWDYVKEFAGKIPGVKFNETELRCDLPNGARRGGYAIFIGTPRGHNAFFDLWQLAQSEDGWYSAMFKASETSILAEEELLAAKGAMTGEQYEQEFECSFIAAVPGAIFGKEIQKIEEKGQVCHVPYNPALRVDTHFDLGVSDATSIWFTQSAGKGAVHVIDFFEHRGEGLPFYARILDEKGYLYGTHHAPHDIEVREMGSGKSRREIAYDLGINFRVVPKLPLEDGLHAGKLMIPRCWFDRENCAKGLEALRFYHRKYDERNRTFRTSVTHDWSSHAADAFRYAAIALRDDNRSGTPPQNFAHSSYNPLENNHRASL